MKIRPETPQDYARIAQINNLAFDNRALEPTIVALKRQFQSFDPELSLVAEIDGRVVGHALFNPATIRLMGQDVSTIILAPIAVDPPYHGQGIGGALIEEGHRIARESGTQIALLLGHTTYYPRFGYRTYAYGPSQVTVSPVGNETLAVRGLVQEDLPALMTLWRHEENDVDFSIMPEDFLMWWLSPNSTITAQVYLRDDQVVGYSRQGQDIKQFLAADGEAAQAMINTLAGPLPSIDLPLHPYSATAKALNLAPKATTWEAAMAMELNPSPLGEYFEAVQSGARTGGRVIWDVAFEV